MRLFLVLFLMFSASLFAQDETLALNYFEKGNYEKALHEYQKLYAQSTSNINYIYKIIETHQQLEQFDAAEAFLLKLITKKNYPAFLVELGFNFQLKNNIDKANQYYKEALDFINERPSHVYAVARAFQNHALLNEAINAYEKAMALNSSYNFSIQLAQLYGEQGHIEKMFNSYLDFTQINPAALPDIKRRINEFLGESGNHENNILFKKTLLKKLQQEPNVLWNQLLSWLFIQQKDFNKAFIQEKAIFNRKPESLDRILELALIAVNDNDTEIATQILNYIITTAQDTDTKLNAHYTLLQLETKQSNANNYSAINDKYLKLFETFGKFSQTLNLQIAYGHFLAFYKNDTNAAISFLEETLELPISQIQKAEVKLQLGDILVLQEKFNQALIYYTQIQRNLKNSTISQEARFRVAKASYYKGDFKWAESQLKILKSSTSQLIANDALDLKLLISDNKYEDSLQTALKLYAKADLLAFQNKKDEAITVLNKILNNHKTEPIIAQTLFKQGQLFKDKNQIEKAVANFETLIKNYSDGILVDDAYFHLAQIYEKQLNQPEKAKNLYEQIIFNHADSIYFVEARKRYRTLRGDAIN